VLRDVAGWVATPTSGDVGLPASVREVIGQRVHRLGEEVHHLLSTAAVIGRDFDLDLLGLVADVPEARLLDALEEAAGAGVVAEVAGRPGGFRFSHALFQHALYEDLPAWRRVRVHQHVATALEELCGGDPGERVTDFAHHWIAASRPISPHKVIEYAKQAGDRALAHLAPDEAVSWYAQALDLARDEAGRDSVLEADLLIGLGEAERQAGQPAFRDTLLAAAGLARRLADTGRLVQATLANNRGMHSSAGEVDLDRVESLEAAAAALGERDVAERALVLATLAAELSYGDWERRRALAEEAVAVARRIGDEATLARVLNVTYTPLQVPEMLPQRLSTTAENLEITQRLGNPGERFRALDFRLRAVREAGRYDEVAGLLAEMWRIPDELGQPVLRWYAGFHASCLEHVAGRLESAEQAALDALQIGNDSGQPEAIPIYATLLVSVRRDQGRLDEVVDLVAQQVEACPGIPGFRAMLALCYCELDRPDDARPHFRVLREDGFSVIPHDLSWSSAMSMLAEVCAALGDADAAAALATQLGRFPAIMADNGISTFGATDRYLGLLAATRGDFDGAAGHFAAAAALHQRIGAPIWLARTRLDWARFLQRRGAPGDRDEARGLLGQVLEVAGSLGCATLVRWAEEARGPGP
jgi:tetratricopeptide (TPR) repeat protein